MAKNNGRKYEIPTLSPISVATPKGGVNHGVSGGSDVGTARMFATMANGFFNLENQVRKQEEARDVEQARSQGVIDGATGEPLKLNYDGTPESKAYNRSAMTTALSSLESDFINDMNRLRSEYQGDPEGLNASLNARRDGFMQSGWGDEIKARAGLSFDRLASRYVEAERNVLQKRQREQDRLTMLEWYDSAKVGAEDLARFQGRATDDAADITDEISRIHGMLDDYQKNGLISGNEHHRMKAKLRDDVMRTRVVSAFEQLQGIEQKAEFLESFKGEYKPSSNLSERGLDMLKTFEGKNLKAYVDGRGISIGYGHQLRDGEDYKEITEEKAEELLKQDVKRFSDLVAKNVKTPIEGHQFDALVSLAYNIGEQAFSTSTLLKKLNKGDLKGAAREFDRWNKFTNEHGQRSVHKGLTKRRAKERELFESGISDGESFTVDSSLATSIERELQASLNRDISALKAEEKARRNQVNQAKKLMKDGITPGGTPVVGGSANDELSSLVDFHKTIKQARPHEITAFINQTKEELQGTSNIPDHIKDRLEIAESLEKTMRKELKNNPLGWAEKTGLIEINPIDISNPELAITSMQQRLLAAEQVAAHYGTDLQLLSPDDTESIIRKYDESENIDEKIGTIKILNDGFGDSASTIYQELSKHDGVLSNVGGLLSKNSRHLTTARKILEGENLLKQGIKNLPDKETRDDVIRSNFTSNNSNAFTFIPDVMQSIIESADRIYAAESYKKGNVDGDYENAKSLYQESLKRASGAIKNARGEWTGGIGEDNQGGKIILPDNMSQATFDHIWNGITSKRWKQAGLGEVYAKTLNDEIVPIALFAVRDEAELVSLGDGMYAMRFSDLGTQGYLADKKGNKYKFNLNALWDTYQEGV